MGDRSPPFDPSQNPLQSDDGRVWDWLIESVTPPAMLVAIAARMSDELKRSMTPDDVWQETLLHAWRDRARCDWRGLKSFRRWLLQVAEHRLHDLADQGRTQKRGGGTTTLSRDAAASAARAGDTHPSEFAGPSSSTTPSRVASAAERARSMRLALKALPEELREVVFLRLFEELTFEEIATRSGITVSGVRHRFRRGLALYHAALTQEGIGRASQ